jgi:integrase
MAKINFTSERIAAFQCEPGKRQSLLWDAKTPGLGLRASDGGSKSYIFETRLNGKTLRTTIGDVRTWSVGKAQAEATRLKAQVDLGLDPRQQREAQLAKNQATRSLAERRDLTLGEVWPIYLEDRKPRWSERHYADHIQLAAPGGQSKKRGNGKTVAGPLAPLMPLKLTDLSASVLAEWAAEESAGRPTNTTQSYRKLRAFIHWAESQEEYCGIVPADSYKARKVRDAVPRPRAKTGDCLQREQLKDWFAAVRDIPNPVFSFYLQGLLLTGARREELALLRWEDVDLKWRSLNIRDKVEGVRTIPLTPYFASLLLALKRINETPPTKRRIRQLEKAGKHWEPSAWVFSSSTSASGHIISPTQPHTDALVAAGLPHVTLHGLRRSFGTLCEWVEMPSGVSAQIMGHRPSALAEKHYRRRPLDLLRKWHDAIEAWILSEAKVDFKPTKFDVDDR